MKRILFTIIFISSTVIHSFANIINVPADQPTIQAGINAAVSGDTVLVAQNTYYENINFNGKNIVVGSWFLTTGDTSYISQTVIDGNQIDRVAIFENGEDTTAILCGFTIQHGYANSGGGIYCNASHPTIEYCKITQNSVMSHGGGIYCINANPNLMNLTVISNLASDPSVLGGSGGGILLDFSNPKLINVTVKGNTALSSGGGIDCANSNPSIKNSKILENSAENGGGMSSCFSSSLSFENVIISNNFAERGGGIYCLDEDMTLKYVTICENTADLGGGISCCDSYIRLVNVTIVNNMASGSGGGIYCRNSISILVNTILWNNSFHEVYFDANGPPNHLYITYSDVQDSLMRIATNNNGMVYWLNGNIDDNPLFVGGTPFNCNLTENSPCIDAGTNFFVLVNDTLVNMDSTNYYGFAPDMGAIESPYFSSIQENNALPFKFTLHQNYPNPFNPSTTIEFDLPKSSEVTLKVFNVLGEEVATLVSDRLSTGSYSYEWDASSLASGMYLYHLEADKFVSIKKLMLLK